MTYEEWVKIGKDAGFVQEYEERKKEQKEKDSKYKQGPNYKGWRKESNNLKLDHKKYGLSKDDVVFIEIVQARRNHKKVYGKEFYFQNSQFPFGKDKIVQIKKHLKELGLLTSKYRQNYGTIYRIDYIKLALLIGDIEEKTKIQAKETTTEIVTQRIDKMAALTNHAIDLINDILGIPKVERRKSVIPEKAPKVDSPKPTYQFDRIVSNQQKNDFIYLNDDVDDRIEDKINAFMMDFIK